MLLIKIRRNKDMAIKGGEIKYSVSFNVNTSQLTKAFDKIQD